VIGWQYESITEIIVSTDCFHRAARLQRWEWRQRGCKGPLLSLMSRNPTTPRLRANCPVLIGILTVAKWIWSPRRVKLSTWGYKQAQTWCVHKPLFGYKVSQGTDSKYFSDAHEKCPSRGGQWGD
jgi:hypothetical protein